ncbi:Holliday junction branch migration protein RuvA [Bifidobacterium gallicum]|uniref:Holliday junction branch migration complex subunit RuvA n=1 Tax=Bifidobacterium gallicum DSM 20093 = LMG 11596 TaxID=561180 RepID=D1NTL9_9BIFI|nr:Holliday junction branch migration protein RuvA [Bifidobacterium gallicum]EFA23073.1 Holliday junction DNA helicase RuvA [Bifidobacterium gallicum DSM 20093 = LMG 11596]KFI58759.1 Holliday junction DNA helicase RuvA [Bifidobacterium gallicum DSM 20093 = LMG 11596]
MIGMLSGQVAAVDTAAALIDVHGVGYEVRMAGADLATLHVGQDATVFTSMSVSQDAITLFGFLDHAAKRMFLQLQKVSGIGPKVALSLLGTLDAGQLAHAIYDGDATALAKAPGLGKKGAQKIILELKGSLDLAALDDASGSDTSVAASAHAPEDRGRLDVVEALISLGWRQQDAQHAVDSVIHEQDLPTPLAADMVPEVLRAALTSLDSGH